MRSAFNHEDVIKKSAEHLPQDVFVKQYDDLVIESGKLRSSDPEKAKGLLIQAGRVRSDYERIFIKLFHPHT